MSFDQDRADALAIDRLARNMIGRFPAACEGRHHYGTTCDYCLVRTLVDNARALLARWDASDVEAS